MEQAYNDIELWRAFKKGDDAAFALMYRLHIKALYHYGQKITSDTQLVEDSIQDLFADLWNSRENLSDTDSIKYYLFRVLRRKISRNLAYPNSVEQLEEQLENIALGSDYYENELINLEGRNARIRHLEHALMQLPARQREVVNLRYFHGFDHAGISGIMGITHQSVHNLLQKSMKSLREILVGNPDLLLLSLIFFW